MKIKFLIIIATLLFGSHAAQAQYKRDIMGVEPGSFAAEAVRTLISQGFNCSENGIELIECVTGNGEFVTPSDTAIYITLATNLTPKEVLIIKTSFCADVTHPEFYAYVAETFSSPQAQENEWAKTKSNLEVMGRWYANNCFEISLRSPEVLQRNTIKSGIGKPLPSLDKKPASPQLSPTTSEDVEAMDQAAASRVVARIKQCWSVLPEERSSGAKVIIGVQIDSDGSLANNPTVLSLSDQPEAEGLAEKAVKAVASCAPYQVDHKMEFEIEMRP